MQPDYILYSWELSYFSGKTRGYLNYKGLNYYDKNIGLLDLFLRIPRNTGAKVMPVIKTSSGEWLQDTKTIVEYLEEKHPSPSVVPKNPTQYIAALLIEMWADEWWVPIAMHYRWSFTDNFALFKHDAGAALLPYGPQFLRTRIVNKVANMLRGFLPTVGVIPEQFAMLESWTQKSLDALDNHFRTHKYLFGDSPNVADFALLGPMYGHLNRDPVPKKMLLDTRPNLQAWVERLHRGDACPEQTNDGNIPESLSPIFDAIFNEFYPLIQASAVMLQEYIDEKGKIKGQVLARKLGNVSCPMGDNTYTRCAMPYTVWMAQRISAKFHAMSSDDQSEVRAWLDSKGQSRLFDSELGPALARKNVITCLA